MENKVKLTIAIPTYNRVSYLSEILNLLINQCRGISNYEALIEIIICDNASTDGTYEYMKLKKASPDGGLITYYRNDVNIGGDLNFIECVKKSKGEYVWIFGDDDLIEDNAIEKVIDKLIYNKYSLIILSSLSYQNRLEGKNIFNNYKELVDYASLRNPHFLLAHTLVTANIFLKQVFNVDNAGKLTNTSYAHMYAVIDNLKASDCILVTEEPIVKIRDIRADFAVPPRYLGLKQSLYLHYIGSLFNNESIRQYSYLFFNYMCRGISRYELLKQALDLKYIGRHSIDEKLRKAFYKFFNSLPIRHAKNFKRNFKLKPNKSLIQIKVI